MSKFKLVKEVLAYPIENGGGNGGNGVDLSINLDDLLKFFPSTGKIGGWTSLTIGRIITMLIPFIYVLAGLGLLLMLIIGGFQLMMSVGNPEGLKSGGQKILFAVIGFIIIFASWWLIQILQVVFGLPEIF